MIVTRRAVLSAALAPLTQRSAARSLPIEPWSYWHRRYPHILLVTSMQQPGHHYRPLGLLTHGEIVWHP